MASARRHLQTFERAYLYDRNFRGPARAEHDV
jgi:hypothetical protein